MQRSGTTVRINVWRIALISSLLVGGVAASAQIEVGYRGPFYPPDTGSNSKPTGEKPESKLWWNDGLWWGVLWSTSGNGYHIHRLDPATQDWVDTGTVIDTRSKSRQDVIWDEDGETPHLYVASHIYSGTGQPVNKASDRGRLYRLSYDPEAGTYSLDGGFPVDITFGKSETLVLAKDSTGQLWIAYVEDNAVKVNHSLDGDDRTWGTPFVLPVADADTLDRDDITSIIAYDGHIGIMWSRQTYNNLSQPTHLPNPHSGREEGDTDNLTAVTMHFAVHDDGADPSDWTSDAVLTASGDDHINLKAFDGWLYAAVKTDKDAFIINLLACETQSSGCRDKSDWKRYPVFRTRDNNGESDQAEELAISQPNPSRPVVLIDTENRDLYVFAMVEQFEHRAIHYKKTKLDDIDFDTADPGVPFIRSETDLLINDPTSTKQNLNSTTGLVVLASDEETTHYFHNHMLLNQP
jgi:hypothetical protein